MCVDLIPMPVFMGVLVGVLVGVQVFMFMFSFHINTSFPEVYKSFMPFMECSLVR